MQNFVPKSIERTQLSLALFEVHIPIQTKMQHMKTNEDEWCKKKSGKAAATCTIPPQHKCEKCVASVP